MSNPEPALPEGPADEIEALFEECVNALDDVEGEVGPVGWNTLDGESLEQLRAYLEPLSGSLESLLEAARSPAGSCLAGGDIELRAAILEWIPDASRIVARIDDDLAPDYDPYGEELMVSEDVIMGGAYVAELLNELQTLLVGLAGGEGRS